MDKLSDSDQAELKKCSTERLVARLCKAGLDEEKILAMDRQALLNAAAELKLNPGTVATKPATGMERELALREQELELRRREIALREEEKRR